MIQLFVQRRKQNTTRDKIEEGAVAAATATAAASYRKSASSSPVDRGKITLPTHGFDTAFATSFKKEQEEETHKQKKHGKWFNFKT